MRKWRNVLIERLKNDPKEAESYLKASLEAYQEDQDTGAFLLALKTLTEARGGIKKLSEKTHLNRTQLYRMFSPTGNPTLNSLNRVLPVLGMKLTIQKIDSRQNRIAAGRSR